MTTTTRPETTLLLEGLRQARVAEHALADTLTIARPLLVDARYQHLVTEHAEAARQRLHDIDARLSVLGQHPGPLSVTVTAMRHLVDDTVDVSVTAMSAGVGLMRRDRIEPALVHAARRQAAAAAFAAATYHVLAETARTGGEATTGKFATACRAACVRLQGELDVVLPALVARACERVGVRPSYRELADVVTARVRGAAQHLGADAGQAQQDLRQVLQGWWRPGHDENNAGTASAKDTLPIAGYPGLTAGEIIDRLPRLPEAGLTTIEQYERGHANRTTVLRKIESLRATRPGPATTP